MSKPVKSVRLEQLALQEGLSEYFEQQSKPAAPALPKSKLRTAVKEALAAIVQKPALTHSFGDTQPSVTPDPQPGYVPASTEDHLFQTVDAIIKAHYSILDPAPEAPVGTRLTPIIYIRVDEPIEVILLPFPPEAQLEVGRLDRNQLDPDMLEKLELLFEHLADVEGPGVGLRYERDKFQFTIQCDDHLTLLHLFEDLMLSQNYPSRDTLYFDSTLDRKMKTEDGQKCFNSRREYLSYLGERTARDRINAKGMFDLHPEDTMLALPARVFTSFADASRVATDYLALQESIPFIDVSFATLEDELFDEAGIDYEAHQSAPPLLKFH